MASEKAKKLRLALGGVVAAAALGGLTYAVGPLLFAGAPSTSVYQSPKAAQQGNAGAAGSAASGQAQASPQAQGQAQAPAERLLVFGATWNTVDVLGKGAPQAKGPTSYVLAFGPLDKPVNVAAPKTPSPLTIADANALASMQSGGKGGYQGVLCLTDDGAVCLVSSLLPSAGGSKPVYTLGARIGGAMMPVATRDGAPFGPLVLDMGSGGALFSDLHASRSEGLTRQDLNDYFAALASNIPAMQQAIASMPPDRVQPIEKHIGMRPFQWINRPGHQEAVVRFVIGDQNGPGGEATIAVDRPERGFIRLSLRSFTMSSGM